MSLSAPVRDEMREKLIDWLNAFKADPFSTGADKVDRLIAVTASQVEAGEVERAADLELALDLALLWLGKLEPGDSRAVSDEFVAMAAIQCRQDNLAECREIVETALSSTANPTGETSNG